MILREMRIDRDGAGVRTKVTSWGGSDPLLCGYPAAQTLLGFGGRYRPRAFRYCSSVAGNAESDSEADLIWTLKKGNRSCTHPKSRNEVSKKRIASTKRLHPTLQRYAICFGEATHDDIISESLDSHFKRDRVFKEWVDNNDLGFPVQQESERQECLAVKATAKTA